VIRAILYTSPEDTRKLFHRHGFAVSRELGHSRPATRGRATRQSIVPSEIFKNAFSC